MPFDHMIPTLDGTDSFGAYVAKPSGEAKAAIIVIQEIFGVNPGIRRKCDRLAAEGYIAIAPDLFWRMERDVELDPDVEAEMQKAFDFFGKLDWDAAILDLEASVKWTRANLGTKKVGCVGYCAGGRLAYLMAARTDVDASVGYYGVMIDQMLDESHAIANPLLLHVAGADQFVDEAAQAKMHEGLDPHPKVTLFDYPGLNHGFATEMGERRNDEAANLADSRTAEFFAKNLA